LFLLFGVAGRMNVPTMVQPADASDEPGPTAEEDEHDWACLSLADLKADLAECEEAVASARPAGPNAVQRASEEELRQALHRSAKAMSANIDADIFFAAQRTLHGLAAELQEVLVDLDTLQFDAAALVASLAHGPLQPPRRKSSAAQTELPAAEVFGPSAAPPVPKTFGDERSLPAQASSLADYQQRLEAMPQVLMLGRRLRLCMGEVDRYQDEKDIGRDQLIVNGEAVSGATGGYATAHETIKSALRVGAEAGGAWQSEQALDSAASLLLSVLGRTCSGFAAFEEVLRLFDCSDVVVVSPESASARPLEAAVLDGVALGRAHTRYAIRQVVGEGEPLVVLDAVFTFRFTAKTLQRLASRDASGAWLAEEAPAAVLLSRV